MKIGVDSTQWDGRIATLAKNFPSLRVRLLSKVGAHGRLTFKGLLMQGDDVFQLHAFPYGDSGKKRTVASKVFRRGNAVRINSFPLNLYNKGRTLRDGKRQTPSLIFPKFVQLMQAKELQNAVNEAEKEIIQKEFDKV